MRVRSSSVKRESPPPGTNVLFDVWLVSRATTALLDQALASSGLTADEFAIYSVLTTTDAMTPSELARWMSAPLTSISSYVKRFEGRGHVVRTAHPADGRSYRLELTAAGRASHRAAGKLFLPVLERVEGALDRPPATVRPALQSLHRAVSAST